MGSFQLVADKATLMEVEGSRSRRRATVEVAEKVVEGSQKLW